jgi:mono/diheme cytochrome c family protein
MVNIRCGLRTLSAGLLLVAQLLVAALLVTQAAQAETLVERGQYLVESIAGCGNCHTGRGPDGPLPDMALAGNVVVEDGPAFRAVAPNITPDPATGIGAWTDTQISTAIREGVRPDGTLIGPPMPIERYRGMADDDVAAIVAYLRTVPAVANVSERSVYHINLPARYGPPVGMIDSPPDDDVLATGAYLAGPIGHCIECHSPLGPQGRRDLTRIGAGGQLFRGPWGVSAAANITSDPVAGLGAWTDAGIERAIRTGISRDGHALKPPMGFSYYARISAPDMAALIAYLRSLPPAPP